MNKEQAEELSEELFEKIRARGWQVTDQSVCTDVGFPGVSALVRGRIWADGVDFWINFAVSEDGCRDSEWVEGAVRVVESTVRQRSQKA